ncbi:MAG: redoxin domain-containing protein [Phycisphaerales bacterium]|nr:redoxin domain-containing protein [Phycisphaerales bacterium]
MRLRTIIFAASFAAVSAFVTASAQDTKPQPDQGVSDQHQNFGGAKFTGRKSKDGQAGRKHAGATVGQTAPDFTLSGVDGKTYHLADYKGKTVILEWFSPYCPVSGGGEGSYWGSGNASKVLAGVKAADPNAVYLTINSTKDGYDGKSTSQNGADSTAVITQAAQTTPVLLDADGTVGRAYGAKTTPHIYIIDGTGKLAYIGAPTSEDGATDYITSAVTHLKAGTPVDPTTTKNHGCGIKYASPAKAATPPTQPATPAAPAPAPAPTT